MQEVQISKIKLNPRNPRTITDEKLEKLKKSLTEAPEMLNLRPVMVDKDMVAIGGNMRVRAARELGLKKMPIVIFTEEMAKRHKLQIKEEDKDGKITWRPATYEEKCDEIIIKDNASFGEYDWDDIFENWDIEQIEEWGQDVPEWGKKEFENTKGEAHRKLEELFMIPPFSVLDSKQGYWKDRKENWKTLINDKGESREEKLFEKSNTSEVTSAMADIGTVSILDPVIAEISNYWFGIDKGKSFDPFAGDSVFGFVSDYMGCTFTGIEIRQEQADLNNKRLSGTKSKYICDDGQNVAKHIKEESQDLLFSCPPYFDLEVYSDLENDASTQDTYEEFLVIIETAFTQAIKCLKDDRFAVIVVGDVRNKKTGEYYGFPEDVIRIFMKNDMKLYNNMILVNSLGTAPQRASRQMKTRKTVKVHQNVIVFYKGNTKTISKNFPKLDVQFDQDEYESENVES